MERYCLSGTPFAVSWFPDYDGTAKAGEKFRCFLAGLLLSRPNSMSRGQYGGGIDHCKLL